MGSSKNAQGKRIFDDVYGFPQDAQSLADDIWDAYVTRAGTSAERNAIPPGQLRDGIVFRETDTGLIWFRDGGAWKVVGGRTPRALMRRTEVALASGSGAYGNLSADAAWALTGTGVTYSNGIVVPISGLYEVQWALYVAGTGFGIVGVAVNATGTPGGNALYALDHVSSRTISLGNASAGVRLNAGDKLTLWGYGEGGAMTIFPASAAAGNQWGARWVAA